MEALSPESVAVNRAVNRPPVRFLPVTWRGRTGDFVLRFQWCRRWDLNPHELALIGV